MPVEDAAKAATEVLAELASKTELARTELIWTKLMRTKLVQTKPEAQVKIRQLKIQVKIQQLKELKVLLIAVCC